MAGFAFNFCVDQEVADGGGCAEEREEATEPLDKRNREQSRSRFPPFSLNQTGSVDISGVTFLEAKELPIVFPIHEGMLDQVIPTKFRVPVSGLEILYVDSNSVEELSTAKTIQKLQSTSPSIHRSSELGNGLAHLLELSNSSHSDLIPGVYEGGLKVWECAFDLVEYLAKSEIQFFGRRILELGCGAGLPAIFALMTGARNVHFQDYNPEVIDYVTIPSVLLNIKSMNDTSNSSLDASFANYGCKFYSGDWSNLTELIPSGHYDIILTSETIYHPASQPKLLATLKHLLHPKEGIAFVAAKSYYFGVGGSVGAFVDLVNEDSYFSIKKCEVIDCEVPREILILKCR